MCDRRLPGVQVFRDGWHLEGDETWGLQDSGATGAPRVESGCRGAVGYEAGRDGAKSARQGWGEGEGREGEGGWSTTRDQYTKIRRQPARTYIRVRVRARARSSSRVHRPTPSIYALTYANCKYNLSGPPCIRNRVWMHAHVYVYVDCKCSVLTRAPHVLKSLNASFSRFFRVFIKKSEIRSCQTNASDAYEIHVFYLRILSYLCTSHRTDWCCLLILSYCTILQCRININKSRYRYLKIIAYWKELFKKLR